MKKFYALSLVFSYLLHAQTNPVVGPGGVPGTVLWMKTVPDSKNLQGGYRWQDFSGDSVKVRYNTANNEYIVTRPDFIRGYNFNPALRLTNSAVSKEIQVVSSNLSTATIIGTFAESAASGEKFTQPEYIMTMNGAKGKGFVLDKDKIINSTESKRGVLDYGNEEGYDLMYHPGKSPEATLTQYKERTLRSFVYYRTNPPVTGVWGERQKANISLGQKFFPGNVNNNSTYDTGLFNPNGLFDGYIPELFIYNRLLTPLERIKTESYLALKYGFMPERSYIGSTGQLLWDIDQNKSYNYRVTGIFRDDISGVYQKSGTTSYEEAPYFSYTVQGDSYDFGNSYNLPNRYKLLALGRFPANTLQDKDFMIWGDNNAPVETQEEEEFLGLKLMNRRWLVQTNMGGKLPAPEEMKWNISPSLNVEKEGYKLTVRKQASSEITPGVLSSLTPLSGYDGHISFTLPNPMGQIIVKFGTPEVPEQSGKNDYGVFINEKGEVYPIIQGNPQWDKKWSILVKEGDRIRINKTKDAFIISSNGNITPQTGQALPQIFIDPKDIDKDFYVSLGIYKWNQETVVKDFRVGGFTDTGNQLELSYIDQRAAEFADHKERSYLLVDRSGTGEFKKETTDLYTSDEYDPYRRKIIFNNVFFDTDANGKDVFTFAYRESNLIADVEKVNPECDTNGNPLSDGKLKINVRRGDEGFEYQLYHEDSLQAVKKGAFFGKELVLEGLPLGKYNLNLKEIGGFNFVSDSTSVEAKGNSHRYINTTTLGDVYETTLKSTDQIYQMGLNPIPNPSGVANIVLNYGFEINKFKIYLIENRIRKADPVPGIELKSGDKLEIYNNERAKVQYRVNGVVFHTLNITTTYFFMAKLNNNVGAAYNVKNTGGTYTNWNYQGTKVEPLSDSEVSHSVVLESKCLPVVVPPEEPEIPELLSRTNKNLVLYYKDFSNQSEITARVSLKKASPLTLTIFNFSGIMVYSKDITESKTDHELDIKGLPKGVYVMKAFTLEGEFSQKMIIN